MNQINLSSIYFPNPSADKALVGAEIYIGQINVDPEIVLNQKQVSVLQPNGNYVQVSQPITTGAGGVPVYNGSPVSIYVSGPYSLKVKTSTGSQAYYIPENANNSFTDSVDSMSDLENLGYTPDDSQVINVYGFASNGDGGGGAFVWDASNTSTPVPGQIVQITGVITGRFLRDRKDTDTFHSMHFGDVEDTGDDSYSLIQNICDYAASIISSTNVKHLTIKLRMGGFYILNTGLILHHGVRLDANGSLITYTGSGTAVQIGNQSNSLNYRNQFINFNLRLSNKTAKGVVLYATSEAFVYGYIEGLAAYDNTRTNVGVTVDGVNASAFMNTISVNCNHIHESFRITTTGSVQPTNQLFLNCSAMGDQDTDDSSIGFNFTDTGITGTGDGTVIMHCNMEKVNIGAYFGDGCGSIDVNARWEINQTATSRTAKFHANASTNINLQGAGLDSAQIGAVPGGIEGFGGSKNHIFGDRNGNIRYAGNDSSFSGITQPVMAIGQQTILLKKNSTTFIRTTDTNTGAGAIAIQPGEGSNDAGAYIKCHGHAHATQAKNLNMGPSQGGQLNITTGYGGDTMARFDNNMSTNETSLWVFDSDTGILKRVIAGPANSLKSGYKAIGIPN